MPNNQLFFAQQKLNQLKLLPLYIAETISPRTLDLNDTQGNPVVISDNCPNFNLTSVSYPHHG